MNKILINLCRQTTNISIILAALWLSGCVTNSKMTMAPPLDQSPLTDQNNGIVIARLVDTSGRSLPFNYLTISPKNLNASKEEKQVRLSPVETIPGDTIFFASQVKPGEYSLSSIRSYYVMGDYWFDFWVGTDASLGTFKVTPGKITDLGTIIYYPKSDGDKYTKVLARSPLPPETKPLLRAIPSLENLDYKNKKDWTEDDLDAERNTLYASILQNPVTYNDKYVSPKGDIYFIGKLGTIIKRTQIGDWEFDAIETDSSLESIIESEDGNLIVGGEQGMVMMKSPNGSWMDISLNTEHNIDALSIPQKGTIDAIARSNNRLEIYRLKYNETNAEWETLTYFTPIFGWHDKNKTPLNIGERRKKTSKARYKMSYSSLSESKGKHFISVGSERVVPNSTLPNIKHAIFSYDSKTWKIAESKGFDKGIDAVVDAGATLLGVKKASAWSFTGRNSYWKQDTDTTEWLKLTSWIDNCPSTKRTSMSCHKNGKEIAKKQKFSFSSVPTFFSNTEGYSVAKFAPTKSRKKAIFRIIETTDGGKTWNIGSKLPSDLCRNMIPEARDVLLISCSGSSGDFYQSVDKGKTWEHVREHESF